MARLPVIVMCPSARAPPVPTRRLASPATKPPTTQKAAYVPRHISCKFAQTVLIEAFAWIAGRLRESGYWYIAIFTVVLRDMSVHFLFLLLIFFKFVGCVWLIQNGTLSAAAGSAIGGGLYEPESGSELLDSDS